MSKNILSFIIISTLVFISAKPVKNYVTRTILSQQLTRLEKNTIGSVDITNPHVKTIQTVLQNENLYTGIIDGKMNNKTRDALQNFQNSKNIEANGFVNPETVLEINKQQYASKKPTIQKTFFGLSNSDKQLVKIDKTKIDEISAQNTINNKDFNSNNKSEKINLASTKDINQTKVSDTQKTTKQLVKFDTKKNVKNAKTNKKNKTQKIELAVKKSNNKKTISKAINATNQFAKINSKNNVQNTKTDKSKKEQKTELANNKIKNKKIAAKETKTIKTLTNINQKQIDKINSKNINNKKVQSDDNVRQVQLALKKSGYYQGNIDGKLGIQTNTAIKNFQGAKSLKADGIAGQKTWEELKKYL